ncbi:MAG: ATP-binding protein [Desulfomonilia bacterium]
MWKDITGHGIIVELLKSYCLSGKVPHAFLFAGALGLGKTRMAKEFFKALNCLEDNGDACDKCRSCLKVMAGYHPDLTELNPLTRWIKVDDVREVLTDVGLKPFEARMKCIIIEPAEHLNTESANALLKTLEEPPSSTVIFLISHRPKLLLPTIVSRCQLIRFSEEEDVDLSRDGSGALQTGDGHHGISESHALYHEIIALLGGSNPALLAKKYFDSEGWDVLPEVLAAVESIIRDIMALRLGCDKVMNESLRQIPTRYTDMEEIENITGLISAMRRGVNENINLRIAATELFIMLSQLAG